MMSLFHLTSCKEDSTWYGMQMYFPYFHELKSLYNGASYQNTDGRKVLYLNGSRHSYAETPALPIRVISFSIMCWINVLSLSSDHPVHIYSDWSEPHQFRIFIYGSHKICANLRNSFGATREMFNLCGG